MGRTYQAGKRLQENRGDGPAAWTVEHGYTYSKGGAGDIFTKEKFGDIQFTSNGRPRPRWTAQVSGAPIAARALWANYEIQVLDSK